MHPALDLLLKKSLDAPLNVKGQIVVDLISEQTIQNTSKIISLIHKLEMLVHGKERFKQSITDSLKKNGEFDDQKVNEIFCKIIEEIIFYENASTIQDFLCAMARTNWQYDIKTMDITPTPPTQLPPLTPFAS